MKLTIELTDAEVKGIKAYVKEVDGEKADKAYILNYISSMISGVLHAPQESVSGFIEKFEKK